MTDGIKAGSHRPKNALVILSFVLMAAMLAISVFIYGAPAGQLAVLILFFVFYVQLPGSLIVRWMGFEECSLPARMALGCFLGWAMNVLLVYIFTILHVVFPLYVIGPLMAAILLIKLISKKREAGSVIAQRPDFLRFAPFCIFLCMAMFFCLLGTQYQYLMPPRGEAAFIVGDKAYHMGLMNAVSHGFPFESPWVKGHIIHYHMFTDIMLSVPISLFGIGADVIGQSFAPLLTVYCVGISFYAFFREMSSKPERAGLYCLIFFLSHMYITRRWSSSLAFKFIFTNANNAGFGISAMLVFILIFRKWYSEFQRGDRSHYRYLVLCLVMVMLITGIKGPIGAVVVAGLWGTMILGVIMRRVRVASLLPVLIISLGFMFIYITVLGASGQVNQAGGASIEFCAISNIAFWKKALVGAMKAIGLPVPVRLSVVMVFFMAFFFTLFFLPFVMGYARELFLVLRGRKPYEPVRVLIYAMAFIGLTAMMVLHYTGHNEIYFGLVTVAFAPIISFWFIEDMEEKRHGSAAAGRILKATVAIMTITVLFTTTSIFGYYVRRGAEAVSYANRTAVYSIYNTVSRDEYRAMMWIRDNTEYDALLANDRYYSVPLDRYSPDNRWNSSFFLYEVYANRASYISGSAYSLDGEKGNLIRREMIENNMKLYDEKNEGRGDMARELGVDYVVVSKRFTKRPSLANDDYEICFSNGDVDIYRVTNVNESEGDHN